MIRVKVGIIDDGYPVMGEQKLSLERITDLVKTQDWGIEVSLRDLNIKLTRESLLWKNRIQINSYNHPETFLREKIFDSDFLIYDWEYKPVCEPHVQLLEILNVTNSKIFIYSGWDKYDHISEILDTDTFKRFLHESRYEILTKSDDLHIEKIVKYIVDKLMTGELIKWNQLDLTIKPSKYLIDSDDLWLLKSLIGTENIVKFINSEAVKTIDENSIRKMFEQSTLKYYLDKNKSILSSSDNQLISSKFGQLQEIPMIDALNIFGIDKLEETKEKGFIRIK